MAMIQVTPTRVKSTELLLPEEPNLLAYTSRDGADLRRCSSAAPRLQKTRYGAGYKGTLSLYQTERNFLMAAAIAYPHTKANN